MVVRCFPVFVLVVRLICICIQSLSEEDRRRIQLIVNDNIDTFHFILFGIQE